MTPVIAGGLRNIEIADLHFPVLRRQLAGNQARNGTLSHAAFLRHYPDDECHRLDFRIARLSIGMRAFQHASMLTWSTSLEERSPACNRFLRQACVATPFISGRLVSRST